MGGASTGLKDSRSNPFSINSGQLTTDSLSTVISAATPEREYTAPVYLINRDKAAVVNRHRSLRRPPVKPPVIVRESIDTHGQQC
jgi:hypothetical protein